MFSISLSNVRLGEKRPSTAAALILILSVASVSAYAQCANYDVIRQAAQAGKKPDNTFLANIASAPETNARFTVPIDRVVGPGTSDEFDGNGFLKNWSTYVSNGVLADNARISVQFSLIDCCTGDPHSGTFVINVNGYPASETRTLDAVNFGYNCIRISTEHLKFAHLAAPGMPVTPVDNEITVTWNHTWTWGNATDIGLGTLTVNAMYPIVLVHGWKSGPWTWGDSPSTNAPCRQDPKGSRKVRDGGFGFIDPLSSGKYPFDCSIQIRDVDSVVVGGAELQPKLAAVIAQFGAKHAHLVAHSKGGLWVRQMLYTLAPDSDGNQPFGIYSLTTIETPHLGSSLADLLMAKKIPLFMALGIVSLDPRILATLFQPSAGAEDQTVSRATSLTNSFGNPQPSFTVSGVQNNAKYYEFGANADLNFNSRIDAAAVVGDEGFPGPFKSPAFLNLPVQQQRFQWLGTEGKGNVHFNMPGRILSIIDFDGPGSFQWNDLAVTVGSALGAKGFNQPSGPQVCNGFPCQLSNHSTTPSNSLALQVLPLIKAAQPMQ